MNIINGDSAAGSFKQAFHIPAEEILVFRDVLSCGALLPLVNIKYWVRQRRDFWKNMYAEHGFGSVDEVEKAPYDFYNDFDSLLSTKDVTLWLGCSLSDQLLLVLTVKFFAQYGLDFDKLNICQYVQFDKRYLTVIGLGMLSPEQIIAYKPNPTRLNQKQITFCLDVWNIITATEPDELVSVLKLENPALPLLHKALQNLFYRFPDITNGLSRFDDVILKAAKRNAPNTARIIGYALGHDMSLEDDGNIHALDTVGDIYLFNRLKNMAKPTLENPLLSLNVMDGGFRETKTEVTEFGLEVLEGKHNVADVNGIDDWVCGVHLDSTAGKIWFRKNNELVLQGV